jgi:TraY domain
MPYRKSLTQVRFRLRQDLLRKLERDAKRADRSLNDEVILRLEDSYDRDDWRATRENWFSAIKTVFDRHPEMATAFASAYAKLENEVEGDFQSKAMRELKSDLDQK